VLFLDARHIFRQLDRAHRDFTRAQLELLANVVRFYRGEDLEEKMDGNVLRRSFHNRRFRPLLKHHSRQMRMREK
jgi:type I restriction enzyme M protein